MEEKSKWKRLWSVNVLCTSAFECFVVERKKIIKRKMERPHVCGVI
jgi:hypothetical protein